MPVGRVLWTEPPLPPRARLPTIALWSMVTLEDWESSMPPPKALVPEPKLVSPPRATLPATVQLVTWSVARKPFQMPPPVPPPVLGLPELGLAPLPPWARLPIRTQPVAVRVEGPPLMMAPPRPLLWGALVPSPLGPPMDWLPIKVQLVRVVLTPKPWLDRPPPLLTAPVPPVATLPRNRQVVMVALEGWLPSKPPSTSTPPPAPKYVELMSPAAPTARLLTNELSLIWM